MEQSFIYVVILLMAGILTAVFVKQVRLVAVLLISILMYVVSYFVWFAFQYTGIIPVDYLLKRTFYIDTYRLVGATLGAVVLFGPPLLPSLVLLLWCFLLQRRKS